jgi:outer membrane protein OmpA-like peptidoglycan-associated protein
MSVATDGSIRGVRSDNRGPFRYFTVAAAPAGTPFECGRKTPPALGCGSVVHGIGFDFDSADIRRESEPVLAELFRGLRAETSSKILIEGHTSSEGAADYNQRLSERRAQAVVADLVRRGLAAGRIAAAGIGETRPIATNNDESGRSLNRRVEVRCQ